MKLLLDTHIWLWSVLEPGKLGRRVARELDRRDSDLWLSPLSVWELLLLCEKRRFAIDGPVDIWVAHACAELKEAPVTREVAMETRNIKLPHRDPVDRLLVATARVFELTLVTADRKLMSVEGLSVLPVR